jgi:hypothetical protein
VTVAPNRQHPIQPDLRLGGENEGASFYDHDGDLHFPEPDPEVEAHVRSHDQFTRRNLYNGNDHIGTIEYNAHPSQPKIWVQSLYIKPEHRANTGPLRAIVDPLIRDGRPIDAMFANEKFGRVFTRAVKSGRLGELLQTAGAQPHWDWENLA